MIALSTAARAASSDTFPFTCNSFLGLLVVLLSCPLFAAPLTGTPLNDGYYALYNLDFASAHARLITLTAEQGHYLAPFARLMLAVGELRDGRVQQGKEILINLSKEFPQNTLYQRQIARLN